MLIFYQNFSDSVKVNVGGYGAVDEKPCLWHV